MAIQNPPRRSAAAHQHIFDLMQQRLDEDAEYSRPRSPLMSQAGPAQMALYEAKKLKWQKEKLREQRRQEAELHRRLDTPPDLASVLDFGRGR